VVGDIAANIDNIIEAAVYARDQLHADMMSFLNDHYRYPAEDCYFALISSLRNNAIYHLPTVLPVLPWW